MHALIIEDQSLVAALIEDMLGGLGYTSFAFANGESEAILAAGERRPDLITAAQRLVDGTGLSAVRAIRDGGRLPAIFITEYGDEVRRLGPEEVCLDKPFSERMLRDAVAQACALVPG